MNCYDKEGNQIACPDCGFKECNCNINNKETIKTIKRHLKGIEKAVDKLEKGE